ncbi:MAG: FAD-dependent oxidoreductase, partial [bacterium]|nr:FAD-dependent oxidoreductase [bacterium]
MVSSKTNTWVCTVCAYVHHGPEPPDVCPICGASADLFEPQEEPEAQAPAAAVTEWRCLNCEYIHEGDQPPEECPICAAAADRFEPYKSAVPVRAVTGAAAKQKIVVVGAGIAGVSAAEALGKTAPETEITLISKEAHFPYYRLNLTRYLAGEIGEDQLPLHPRRWYDEQGINFLKNTELSTI